MFSISCIFKKKKQNIDLQCPCTYQKNLLFFKPANFFFLSPNRIYRMSDANHSEGDVEHEQDVNYQPPPQKTIEEIMAADQEDESLRKYKEALLGTAQVEKIIVGM